MKFYGWCCPKFQQLGTKQQSCFLAICCVSSANKHLSHSFTFNQIFHKSTSFTDMAYQIWSRLSSSSTQHAANPRGVKDGRPSIGRLRRFTLKPSWNQHEISTFIAPLTRTVLWSRIGVRICHLVFTFRSLLLFYFYHVVVVVVTCAEFLASASWCNSIVKRRVSRWRTRRWSAPRPLESNASCRVEIESKAFELSKCITMRQCAW